DSDGDGMADDWEVVNGLNPDNRTDAGLDLDLDGFLNFAEFPAGTDPQNPAAYLELRLSAHEAGVRLTFNGMPGKGYTVMYTDGSLAGEWRVLFTTFPSVAGNIEVPDAVTAGTARYYRLVLQH